MSISKKEIWTIGHSTRSKEEFVGLLSSYDIAQLVDVRRHPSSRKFPHFKKEELALWLPEHEISYLHMENLGGRRRPAKDSINSAWRLDSFRGYADYMETESFQGAAHKLQEIAEARKTAFMCSEAVWWSCHRALISDYLKIRNWDVMHIMSTRKVMEHPFTKPARIENGQLTYSE